MFVQIRHVLNDFLFRKYALSAAWNINSVHPLNAWSGFKVYKMKCMHKELLSIDLPSFSKSGDIQTFSKRPISLAKGQTFNQMGVYEGWYQILAAF